MSMLNMLQNHINKQLPREKITNLNMQAPKQQD